MITLILGSGPGAVEARTWHRAPFDRIVAINNAWRIREDWNDLVYPYDFPADRMPATKRADQGFIDETKFVPAQNAFGGFVYAGATMAYTATYWALQARKPRVIGYLGCDMVYPKKGATHFYGTGTADPLRDDISLRSLEAKSARALCYAARQDCARVNLSSGESRLVFDRASPDKVGKSQPPLIDWGAMKMAEVEEDRLGYRTPTGFYDHIDADLGALDAIDALWLEAAGQYAVLPTASAA